MRPRDGLFGRVLPEVEPFVAERPSWQEQANCRGMGVAAFFPDRGDSVAVAEAKQVCADCVVRAECREFSLSPYQREGIWGGLTERERRGGGRRGRRRVS